MATNIWKPPLQNIREGKSTIRILPGVTSFPLFEHKAEPRAVCCDTFGPARPVHVINAVNGGVDNAKPAQMNVPCKAPPGTWRRHCWVCPLGGSRVLRPRTALGLIPNASSSFYVGGAS